MSTKRDYRSRATLRSLRGDDRPCANLRKHVMTLHQWLGIAIFLLLVGFFVFAFRQGEKVRPSGRDANKDIENIPPASDHHP
jgi:hypothetical protein